MSFSLFSDTSKHCKRDDFSIQQTPAVISMQTANFVTQTATAIIGNATSSTGQQQALGMVNATVAPTDPRVVVSGKGWDVKPSTCDKQVPSQQNSNPGQTLTFSFTGTFLKTILSSMD